MYSVYCMFGGRHYVFCMRHCVCIILLDHQHPQLATADAE